MQRVPVEIILVPTLWPEGTLERVSKRRTIYWSKAFSLGPDVHRRYLAHALAHVIQRERLAWRYVFVYAYFWVLAGFSYDRHRMEAEARAAETDPWYLEWAADLIRESESWEAA